MDKSEYLKKLFAGLFLLGGVILMTVMVFSIGKDKGLAQSKFQVIVLYKNVGGLVEGAPVRISGVTVGNVARIEFLAKEVEGRRVKVVLTVFSKYKKQLEKALTVNILTEGILGEKLVEIEASEIAPKVDLTKPIMGTESNDVQELMQAFTEAAESFTKTSQDFSNINLKELSDVLGDTAKSLSQTSQNLNAVLEETKDITFKSKRLIDRIEQKIIDGNLFKVF